MPTMSLGGPLVGPSFGGLRRFSGSNCDPSRVERGLPLVAWDMCAMPKDERGLGLVDVATYGSSLAAKWVVW